MNGQHLYTDLEIHIRAARDDGYPIDLALAGRPDFPRGYLSSDLLPWVASASPTEDGARLFDWLLTDDRVRTAWAQAKGRAPQRRIRLRIDDDAPELHALPWELLRESGVGTGVNLAAATATPFSRYLAVGQPPGTTSAGDRVRILVAIANPDGLEAYGLQPVDAEREWSILQEALTGAAHVDLVRLDGPCTPAALRAHLLEGVHILHFVGHGRFSAQQGAALFLADEQNQVNLVPEQELADLFANLLTDTDPARSDRLRLLYLSSCATAARSPADAFRGLAPKLVAAGAPAVLAMQDPVPVSTAQSFASAFYGRLMQHGLVDLAANEARAAVMAEGLAGASTPVLFTRVTDGRLFDPPQTQVPAGQSGRRTALLAGAVLLALLLLLWAIWGRPMVTPAAEPTTAPAAIPTAASTPAATRAAAVEAPAPTPICADDRHCAILAEFSPIEDELAGEITRKIRSELMDQGLLPAGRFDIQTVPAIDDIDQVDALARREGAQMVIWGEIFRNFEELSVNFELTNQLGAGQSNQLRPYRVHAFESVGQRLTCSDACFESAILRTFLDRIGRVAAYTAAGLIHYGTGNAGAADRAFALALYCGGEAVGDESIDLSAVDCVGDDPIAGFDPGAIYYYAGKAKTLLGDYAAAIAYLQEAADRHRADPAPSIGLAIAYQSWLEQHDAPQARAALDEAEDRATRLRAEKMAGSASAREMAAVDYELGVIAELRRDWARAQEHYAAAVAGFDAGDPSAYVSLIALGRVQQDAGDAGAAAATFEQAAALDPGAPWAALELARLHAEDRPAAEELLAAARAAAPGQVYVDVVEADLCTQWEVYDCAAAAHERALQMRPDSGWLHGRVGDFYGPAAAGLPHQNWTRSAEHYAEAVQQRPNDPWAHERLGFAHYYAGDAGAASAHFASALTDLSHPDRQTPERYCNLGQVQQSAGRLEEALASYRTCLETLEGDDLRLAVEESIRQIEVELGAGSE